ncbi:Smr/MutS family protein [Roseicitreum antarcticum]|uniref:DNA-nicking endonuclease, Smr domain n=1 Tax=Roseicitreum antarcticum TaxID=564137 RepID=A0A1H2QZX0_9RHOB|nr:Smr/MutS family protein [Roseicitreum antarcticum]SDW12713.1 DNA-nicking endonuclease, Smr domain [Roseicitreum antarcticum]
MARRRSRNLDPAEQDLWQKVARTARAMHSFQRAMSEASAPEAPKPISPPPEPLAQFRVGSKAGGSPVLPPADTATAPVRMDRKAYDRLRRGKLTPDAKIDLHGMTLAEAHPALIGFIMRCHVRGDRLVLVITGKGRTASSDGLIPRRQGALKQDVPHWLRNMPLRPLVLELREAHQRHGGAGALYVYLRRPGRPV